MIGRQKPKKAALKGVEVGDTVKIYCTSDLEEREGTVTHCKYLVGVVSRLEEIPVVLLSKEEDERYDWYLEEFEVEIEREIMFLDVQVPLSHYIKSRKILIDK